MVRLQEEMTNVLVPQLEAITPGSGCYLNEVNPLLFPPPNLPSQAQPKVLRIRTKSH